MPTRTPAGPELKSFVSTNLLFTRMGDSEAITALEFLGTAGPEDAAVPFGKPAELAGV